MLESDGPMSERVKFLMSFRGRLMLLLTSFILLTIVVVLALDNRVQKQVDAEVEHQSRQVKDAVSGGLGDLAQAIGIAVGNLNTDTYLYDRYKPGDLPSTIEHIFVTDEKGRIKDTTLQELSGREIPVPEHRDGDAFEEFGDPVESEVEIQPHNGLTKTYNVPVTTDRGLHWIVIVQQQQGITNQIDSAQAALASKNQQLSNYRILATTGLLAVALALAVVIGWRFTRPIQDLARSARRVAAGDLSFQVRVERNDEVGQLAGTFNEMIDGLRSKRELEEKLNQSERAAAIGRLTQAVAHEIRNPLNVINLSIDHASTKFAPEDGPRRAQFTRMLSSIKDEILRLNRLVGDLLHYGRPAQLSIQLFDMRGLLDDTLSLLRSQAEDQNISIRVEQSSEPVLVRGDRERLKSCLSNVVINALQSMPNGGDLQASVCTKDGSVRVRVRDTGVGISEDALTRIFEPYFSTKQTGFGLGLAVTKKIVDEHGGEIEVESRLEEGTAFTISLPAVMENRPDGSGTPEAAAPYVQSGRTF